MPAALRSDTREQSKLAALLGLNRDYIASVQNPDVARFDEILADDFLCSHPHGSLADRARFLEQTARPVAIRDPAAEDVNISLMGDVAIIKPRRRRGPRPLHRRVGAPRRALALRLGARDAGVTASPERSSPARPEPFAHAPPRHRERPHAAEATAPCWTAV